MTITINDKVYTIVGDAFWDYNSFDHSDPQRWVTQYLTDGEHDYQARYYVGTELDENEYFDLDDVDYEEPTELIDLGEC